MQEANLRRQESYIVSTRSADQGSGAFHTAFHKESMSYLGISRLSKGIQGNQADQQGKRDCSIWAFVYSNEVQHPKLRLFK